MSETRGAHHLMWYIIAEGITEEIEHILVSTHWRILQNCMIFGMFISLQLSINLLLHSKLPNCFEKLKDLAYDNIISMQ